MRFFCPQILTTKGLLTFYVSIRRYMSTQNNNKTNGGVHYVLYSQGSSKVCDVSYESVFSALRRHFFPQLQWRARQWRKEVIAMLELLCAPTRVALKVTSASLKLIAFLLWFLVAIWEILSSVTSLLILKGGGSMSGVPVLRWALKTVLKTAAYGCDIIAFFL